MGHRQKVLEIVCLVALFAWLAWVPLPFGSATDRAQTPFVVPPLILAAVAAMLFARRVVLGPAARRWLTGGAMLVATIAIQLIPLPPILLRAISPQSARVWRDANRVAMLAGAPAASFHPISVDPSETLVQLFRVAAYVATFAAAIFLVHTNRRRVALATMLAFMAMFEAVYAVREAALQRYAIWGWRNTLIFNRATGTFVNPNHFAHYAAIILPLALFLCAYAWHTAAPPGVRPGRRLVAMVERRFLLFGFAAIAALACVVAMLVAQSRGALVATAAGLSAAGAMASGRRHAVTRAALIAVVAVAVFAGVFFLVVRTGESTHLQDINTGSLEGRRSSVIAALRIWRHYPVFGSGAGTFESLAPAHQDPRDELIANHAHNDYVETLATTGAVGFLVAVVPLFGGFVALARVGFGPRDPNGSWRRRAFAAAALTSIAIALVHALIDFNFYIPANPATLAAIAGAAVTFRAAERSSPSRSAADDSA